MVAYFIVPGLACANRGINSLLFKKFYRGRPQSSFEVTHFWDHWKHDDGLLITV